MNFYLHLYLWGTSMDATYNKAAMHWWCFENPIYELWRLGSWFISPAMLTLPWQNIINIQTHMCSKYKYKCIQHTNIIVSYMQIQINLRSVDWVVGLWDLTCWHCRDKKAMGVSECTKIQIHENRRKKQLFLQTQIMHCPVELMLLQNSVGWIRCIVVLD